MPALTPSRLLQPLFRLPTVIASAVLCLSAFPALAQTIQFGQEISLQSHHGRFLVAEPDGRLGADRRDPRTWERFEVVDPADPGSTAPVHFGDRIALRSFHDRYVVADSSGEAGADRSQIGPWEIWTLVDPADSSATGPVDVRQLVALRSHHDTHLVAEKDHRARADRSAIGPWERWRIGLEWTDFYYDEPLPCPGDECCECPARGRFDGANCFVGRPPAGQQPFLWEGDFYYPSSGGSWCPLGTFDGANCKVGHNPGSGEAFLWNRGFYLRAHCQPVTGWADLHTHMLAEYAWPPGFIWGTVDDLATPAPEPATEALPCCDGLRTHASLREGLGLLSEGLTQLGEADSLKGQTSFLGFWGESAGDSGLHLGKRHGFIRNDCPHCSLPGLCRDEVPDNISAAALVACNAKSRSACEGSGYCGARGSSLVSIRDDLDPCWARWPDCDAGDLCLQSIATSQLTCSDLDRQECVAHAHECSWAVCRHRSGGGALECNDLSRDECGRYSSQGCSWAGFLGCRKTGNLTEPFECNDLTAGDCRRHGECELEDRCFKAPHQITRPLECNDLTLAECARHGGDGCRVRDCVKVNCRWENLACDNLDPSSDRHFRDWPAWDTPTHQQHWWGHVQDAHRRGLQILSVSILSVHPMARLMSGPQRTPYRTILDQLDAAHRFADLHDWVEIATSPEDARRIIRQGKLALVLTLEAEFPFCRQEPCGTGPDETDHAAILATLDEYRNRGLAAFQVVAHFDNPFAGLAVFSQAMHTLQWFHDELLRDGEVTLAEISAAMTPPGTVTGQAVRRVLREAGSNLAGQILTNFHSLEELNDFHALLGIMGGISGPQCEPRGGGSPIHCGRCLDAKNPIACENVLGLTPLGRWFIGELMNRHMLIDVAHMSERGIREAVAMAREHQPAPYPVYVSHGNPRSALVAGAFKGPHMEKPSSDEILELIAATGGMFGQRTGADAMISSGINDCQGSSKAFAEALKYLVDFSETNSDPLPIAFALDMNGMTHQAVPRFVDSTDARTERRSDRAACLGNDIAQGIQQRPVSDHPATPFTDETDLNRKGLGHIGLLGAFVDDLENVGLDQKYLDALDSSAESFLQMWERSR